MGQVEDLMRQAAALLAEADRIKNQPEDDFSIGAVITWEKQFRPGDRIYQYVALKTSRGWYVTGYNAGMRITWKELLPLIDGNPVWYASEWTEA